MKATGDLWEVLAIEYLQRHGYTIKDTNFKFWRFWEIDIIGENRGRIYFIEVKYRSHVWYGTPEESITKSKLFKCRKTVEYYCKKHNHSLENIQFDVITIVRNEKERKHQLKHYRNIEI